MLNPSHRILCPNDIPVRDACPASGLFRAPKASPTRGQWWGIFIHKFIEKALTNGRDSALQYIEQRFPRGLNACRAIRLSALPPGDVEVEYVLDVTYALVARTNYHNADPLSHAYARCDLIGTYNFGTSESVNYVLDFKCGAETPDPATSVQIRTQALMRFLDVGDDERPVTGIIQQVTSDGLGHRKTHVFSPDELIDHLALIQRVHLKVLHERDRVGRGEAPNFTPGDHCEKCDLIEVCPAHVGGPT